MSAAQDRMQEPQASRFGGTFIHRPLALSNLQFHIDDPIQDLLTLIHNRNSLTMAVKGASNRNRYHHGNITGASTAELADASNKTDR